MQFKNIIVIVLFLLSMLIIISVVKTIVNKKRVTKIFKYLNTKQYVKLYGNKCYYSATGLKKNYPSYPCKLEIYLTENEVIFVGKNNFPFIFKTIENPFILSSNPDELQKTLSFKRIFKPTKVFITNKTLNLNFIDNITFNTNIDYQIDLVNSEHIDKLKRLTEWC